MPSRPHRPRRTTIVDIARELELSIASVSCALNGKPGVSEATRERILRTAREMGWTANHAARSLQSRRSQMIGLVLRRDPADAVQISDFMLRFIDGLNQPFTSREEAIALRTVRDVEAEIRTYRDWASQGRVDALVITDVMAEDPRLPLLAELDVPAVVVGDVRGLADLPSVWTDDEVAMRLSIEHLAAQGHRTAARIHEGEHLRHGRVRSAAFARAAQQAGIGIAAMIPSVVGADAAARQLQELLASDPAPTALQFDSSLRAAEALRALRGMGLRVPEDIALLTLDNSPLCEITEPGLTAIDRDAFAYGATAGRAVLALLETDAREDVQGTTSRLVRRGSS
ncbi:LacI family DNA-binding transcriptional regulator [Brachybacterium hainanense]|uniref:LacI family DNA-binding transcriptional regulator n=1 Tax=Brachybacterium hainanense TaxID=1541174 RepID=A0ABV6R8B0_9MICO